MATNILVLIPLNEKEKQKFENLAPGAIFTFTSQKKVTKEQAQRANIILGNVPHELVKDSENLRWLQLESAGVGIFTNEGVLPEGVTLTNAKGAYGLAISEYMVGCLFALYKNLHLYRDNQTKKVWEYRGSVNAVQGATALIIGLGDIGSEFAKRAKALGAYTIGVRRKGKSGPDFVDEVHTMDSLDYLLPRADIVALSLPSTPKTQKVLNEKTLMLLKSNAVIINVGRGDAIDTDALVKALSENRIWGAALDVTDPEPLPSDHPLWQLENVIITPHVSGGYSLDHTHTRIFEISCNNLKLYLKGKDLENVVSFKEGY